jgi:glutathione S-transferase
VRYALAAKKVPYQCVELDCDVKAQWHAEFNGGEIPVLETPEGELF